MPAISLKKSEREQIAVALRKAGREDLAKKVEPKKPIYKDGKRRVNSAGAAVKLERWAEVERRLKKNRRQGPVAAAGHVAMKHRISQSTV